MIIDLGKFIDEERGYWNEFELLLDKMEKDSAFRMPLAQVKRFHYLYQRASADLAKVSTFASEQELRGYLEALVARGYSEIHETSRKPHRLAFFKWFSQTFPQTFRRRIRAFGLALGATVAGALFGAFAIALDSEEAKEVVIGFEHLAGSPSERVAQEESAKTDRMKGHKSQFSARLMANNIKVSIFALALGVTWGIGAIIVLFYNGVILGAVGMDYILDGQAVFLFGWLLPHGVIEIPAILIAGQAGFVLAGALIGSGRRMSMGERLREVMPDIMTLIGGVAALLVWAGLIESFVSQYHEPTIPYAAKIAFGVFEFILLAIFLLKAGKPGKESRWPRANSTA